MNVYSYKPIFQKTELPNGVRIVTESHPFTRAVAIGMFAELGTRDESKRCGGISHFLEHLVFKGTKRRSAFQISKELEAVGGDLNAYTTREYTCFHATSLKEHLELSLDVLTDLMTGARLRKEDIVKERDVIVQEIQMAKDSLEDYIVDVYLEKAFEGHALANSILGTEESLDRITRKDVLAHYEDMFRGGRVIVSVAGPVDHDHVVKLVSKTLGHLPKRTPKLKRRKPKMHTFHEYVERPSEQVHLLVGLPSCPYQSPMRFESFVVNDLLGGGVTSRLFQKIREDRGLVYTVYSYLQSFLDTGMLMVYAGTSGKNARQVLQIVRKELDRFADKGIRESELRMFKTQVRGQILLGSEDMENRMNSLGINEMVFGRYKPIDEVIEDIEQVSVQSVNDYVGKYVDTDQASLMVMGDLPATDALKLLNVWE